MGELFNYDNAFFRIFDKVINVFYISVLWIIFCIPIFTVGASTTAMYHTINRVLRHSRSYVFREFWDAFKQNFKQSTIVWLILLAFGLFMAWDSWIMRQLYEAGQQIGAMYIFFYVMIAFEVMWALYIFPNIARFENTTKQILKNSALMAIAHLPWTLLGIVILALFLVLDWVFPFTIVFIPACFMWLWNLIIERNFRKYMSEEDRAAEDEKNRDEYN